MIQWCRLRGCRGCQLTPKSFALLRIWANSLKIRAKSLKIWALSLKIWAKSLKIWAKSLKIRAKMAPNVVWLQKMAPNVCRKTQDDLLGEVTPKKGLHDLCGKIFGRKSRTKSFQKHLGKFGQKSFAPPKICLLLHLWADSSKVIKKITARDSMGKRFIVNIPEKRLNLDMVLLCGNFYRTNKK